MIKGLWYARKVRKYEALVQLMTKKRNELKVKQSMYQDKAEQYRGKLKKELTV